MSNDSGPPSIAMAADRVQNRLQPGAFFSAKTGKVVDSPQPPWPTVKARPRRGGATVLIDDTVNARVDSSILRVYASVAFKLSGGYGLSAYVDYEQRGSGDRTTVGLRHRARVPVWHHSINVAAVPNDNKDVRESVYITPLVRAFQQGATHIVSRVTYGHFANLDVDLNRNASMDTLIVKAGGSGTATFYGITGTIAVDVGVALSRDNREESLTATLYSSVASTFYAPSSLTGMELFGAATEGFNKALERISDARRAAHDRLPSQKSEPGESDADRAIVPIEIELVDIRDVKLFLETNVTPLPVEVVSRRERLARILAQAATTVEDVDTAIAAARTLQVSLNQDGLEQLSAEALAVVSAAEAQVRALARLAQQAMDKALDFPQGLEAGTEEWKAALMAAVTKALADAYLLRAVSKALARLLKRLLSDREPLSLISRARAAAWLRGQLASEGIGCVPAAGRRVPSALAGISLFAHIRDQERSTIDSGWAGALSPSAARVRRVMAQLGAPRLDWRRDTDTPWSTVSGTIVSATSTQLVQPSASQNVPELVAEQDGVPDSEGVDSRAITDAVAAEATPRYLLGFQVFRSLDVPQDGPGNLLVVPQGLNEPVVLACAIQVTVTDRTETPAKTSLKVYDRTTDGESLAHIFQRRCIVRTGKPDTPWAVRLLPNDELKLLVHKPSDDDNITAKMTAVAVEVASAALGGAASETLFMKLTEDAKTELEFSLPTTTAARNGAPVVGLRPLWTSDLELAATKVACFDAASIPVKDRLLAAVDDDQSAERARQAAAPKNDNADTDDAGGGDAKPSEDADRRPELKPDRCCGGLPALYSSLRAGRDGERTHAPLMYVASDAVAAPPDSSGNSNNSSGPPPGDDSSNGTGGESEANASSVVPSKAVTDVTVWPWSSGRLPDGWDGAVSISPRATLLYRCRAVLSTGGQRLNASPTPPDAIYTVVDRSGRCLTASRPPGRSLRFQQAPDGCPSQLQLWRLRRVSAGVVLLSACAGVGLTQTLQADMETSATSDVPELIASRASSAATSHVYLRWAPLEDTKNPRLSFFVSFRLSTHGSGGVDGRFVLSVGSSPTPRLVRPQQDGAADDHGTMVTFVSHSL